MPQTNITRTKKAMDNKKTLRKKGFVVIGCEISKTEVERLNTLNERMNRPGKSFFIRSAIGQYLERVEKNLESVVSSQ